MQVGVATFLKPEGCSFRAHFKPEGMKVFRAVVPALAGTLDLAGELLKILLPRLYPRDH